MARSRLTTPSKLNLSSLPSPNSHGPRFPVFVLPSIPPKTLVSPVRPRSLSGGGGVASPRSLVLPALVPGKWTVSLNFDTARLALEWDADGAYKALKAGGGTIEAKAGGVSVWKVDVPAGTFPPSHGGVYRGGCAVTFSITLHHPADSPWDLPKLVEQTASSLTSLSPNNVRLFFPRSGRSLYANETFLSNASPYFKTLFEAGFSKDDKAAADRTSTAETLPPYTFDDSDDETDGFLDKPTSSSEPSSIPCKTIKIIDTAYSTYFAVLVWLVTGKISFAPSRSSRTMPPPRPSSAASTRSMAIKTAIDAQTVPVPPPVSAKSVYRLAHLLKLDSLASFALSQIRSQLTIENVAYTLYSDIASAYPEVQSAALDFAVEKWEKVVGAEATNEMERLAEGGEADSAMAATAMKLAKRLAGRIK
ncbi:hypothetical protein BJY59DRAFT_718569 [Rhodotorula toruloides]